LMATYRDAEDLISVGAYQEGTDPEIDRARRLEPELQAFLAQTRDEVMDLDTGLGVLRRLLSPEIESVAS